MVSVINTLELINNFHISHLFLLSAKGETKAHPLSMGLIELQWLNVLKLRGNKLKRVMHEGNRFTSCKKQ